MASKTPTKTLTLKDTLGFIPVGYRQGYKELRPGDKVKVTFVPGLGLATAYHQFYDGMYESVITAADKAAKFKNWPVEWVLREDNPSQITKLNDFLGVLGGKVYYLYETEDRIQGIPIKQRGAYGDSEVEYTDALEWKRARKSTVHGTIVIHVPWAGGTKEFLVFGNDRFKTLEQKERPVKRPAKKAATPQYKGYYYKRLPTSFGQKYFAAKSEAELVEGSEDFTSRTKEDLFRLIDEYGGVSNPKAPMTVESALHMLTQELTTWDRKQSAADVRRKIPPNIYRLGHLLAAVQRVRGTNPQTLEALAAAIRDNFTYSAPVNKVLKAMGQEEIDRRNPLPPEAERLITRGAPGHAAYDPRLAVWQVVGAKTGTVYLNNVKMAEADKFIGVKYAEWRKFKETSENPGYDDSVTGSNFTGNEKTVDIGAIPKNTISRRALLKRLNKAGIYPGLFNGRIRVGESEVSRAMAAWKPKGKHNPDGPFVAAKDDWPLKSGRQWWSIYDSRTGTKINLKPGVTGGWRVGSEAKAQKIADKMNREAAQGKRNPSSAAAELFESFHGAPSTGETEVIEEIHYHGHLAELGELTEIKVDTLSGYSATVAFEPQGSVPRPTLCSSEDGKQLYIRGGDQSLNLHSLHMDAAKWVRDKMVIGLLTQITYRTKKKFDDFKVIDYYHDAGEESGVQPIVEYDTLNNLIEIAGGQYQVEPRGIVN